MGDPNTSPAMGFTRDLVKVGSWMCEAALWVHWTHVGRATSVHPCKILVVHAEPLIRNLKKHRLVQQFSRGYSNQFYKCVCASRPPLNKWPTDLFVANTDFSEMVVALPQDIRTAIGLHVLENRGEGDKLQNEVLQGTSSLVPTENGGAQRVVLVAVFHIQRDDGRVLVQLGFREAQGMVPLCVLPGAKYRPDDGVDVAAQRVLRTKLGFLHGDVDVYQSRKKSDEYTSRRHGVHTKYVRTIFFARMRLPGTPLWRIAHRAHSSFFSNVSQVFYGARPRSYDVHQWDVFAHEDPMRTTVYGWLTPDEFKLFEEGTLQSDHILSNLMSSLIEPAPVECLELQDGCNSVPESMRGCEETGEDDVCDDDASD